MDYYNIIVQVWVFLFFVPLKDFLVLHLGVESAALLCKNGINGEIHNPFYFFNFLSTISRYRVELVYETDIHIDLGPLQALGQLC